MDLSFTKDQLALKSSVISLHRQLMAFLRRSVDKRHQMLEISPPVPLYLERGRRA